MIPSTPMHEKLCSLATALRCTGHGNTQGSDSF